MHGWRDKQQQLRRQTRLAMFRTAMLGGEPDTAPRLYEQAASCSGAALWNGVPVLTIKQSQEQVH